MHDFKIRSDGSDIFRIHLTRCVRSMQEHFVNSNLKYQASTEITELDASNVNNDVVASGARAILCRAFNFSFSTAHGFSACDRLLVSIRISTQFHSMAFHYSNQGLRRPGISAEHLIQANPVHTLTFPLKILHEQKKSKDKPPSSQPRSR